MPDTCPGCGCDTGQPQHADYPHEPGRLHDCPACEASCHCTANAAECVYEGEHNGLARLNLRLVDRDMTGVPAAVLPGTDYQVTTDEDQLAGWVINDIDATGSQYEAYGPDAKFIGTADTPELAAALIPVPPVPEPSTGPNADGNPYAQFTPEHRVWAKAQENGKAAASWVTDGNTPAETYRYYLRGIEDGDPAVLDSVRTPDLSGEYRDEYTEDQLLADVGWVPHDGTDLMHELCDQYNLEVSTAFWNEVERRCLAALPHGLNGDPIVQLGQKFITCRCGHRESGGAYDSIAEQNFAHHLKTAATAREDKEGNDAR